MIFIQWFSNQEPVIQGLIATLFTYFITVIGASVVFLFNKLNQKILDLMMGLSAGVMIAASFWSLLSPAISLLESMNKNAYVTPALGFLFGGLFIIGSDLLLNHKTSIPEKSKKSLLLTTSVTLHNIPEGLAVGVAFGSLALGVTEVSLIGAILLALGIGLQNFPEGACVAMPLLDKGCSKKKAFFIGQMSGIVEPFAGVIGVLFAMNVRNILPFFLSFSAGAMIAVVCSELIPDSFKDNKTLASIGIITGFIIMMVLDVALG